MCSTHCGSIPSNSTLSDILALPTLKVHQQKRKVQAVNAKARCITDTDVLEELKAKEWEKVEKEETKMMQKLERQRKIEIKMKQREAQKKQSKRCIYSKKKTKG